jgi:integrase/recombinase XerD
VSSNSLIAPSRHTRSFHNQKTQYGENSIDFAVKSGLITSIDAELIRKFIVELRATRGISLGRTNKIIFTVVGWRRFIGEYQQNSIHDIYAGITRLNDARIKGRPYKQNTRRDFLNFLKRFYESRVIIEKMENGMVWVLT